MYLSYSGFKKWTSCPYEYYHDYVAKTVPIKPENGANTLYGSTTGSLYEIFYKEQLWRSKNPEEELLRRVEPTLNWVIEKELKKRVIRWKPEDKDSNYTDREQLLRDIRETVPRGLQIIRQHRLIGPQTDAEVVLDRDILFGSKVHRIGGRTDFIIRRVPPTKDLLILDGKGSRHRQKYVDIRQLRWYGWLYELGTGVLPDLVGFVYWRSEPQEAVDLFPILRREIDKLRDQVATAIQEIETATKRLEVLQGADGEEDEIPKIFPAVPGNCRLCTYSAQCRAGKAFLAKLDPNPDDGVGGISVEKMS